LTITNSEKIYIHIVDPGQSIKIVLFRQFLRYISIRLY
jgi:hypothetical protein